MAVSSAAIFVSAMAIPCFADESSVPRPRVLAKHPHDPAAFTQGLLVFDGDFFESTGLYGESTLRRVEIETGSVLTSLELDESEFGEGLARVDDRLIQLTWQEGVAHSYALDDFEPQESFSYDGEGWGLCFDGEVLVMSDGSSELFFRDPTTFELLGVVPVTLDGQPVAMLNELECVGGQVYSNVWQTDRILRIDKTSGEVVAVIDASGLLSEQEAGAADVLNGIAYDPERHHFFITGKLWPWVFEVELDRPEESGSRLPQGCGCNLAGDGQGRYQAGTGLLLILAMAGRWLTARRRAVRRARSCRPLAPHQNAPRAR